MQNYNFISEISADPQLAQFWCFYLRNVFKFKSTGKAVREEIHEKEYELIRIPFLTETEHLLITQTQFLLEREN